MIAGLEIFSINNISDERGLFREVYKNKKLLNFDLIQENESISHFGVFRGMHFQTGEYSQGKLLRVVQGEIIDFICDLRLNSKSYGFFKQIQLDNSKMIYIPKGLAHGFLSLSDNTIINYKCDNYYSPKYESGFNLFKSDFKINLPIDKKEILISKKDNNLPSFQNSYKFNF